MTVVNCGLSGEEIVLSFPDEEAAHLREAYEMADVILEYGSGGSTVLAASMSGKLVFSVESDRAWSVRLQSAIDRSRPRSGATIYHVDIGPTGKWGRPSDESGWRKYHRYPSQIWGEPFFRHPDVILIDGRFRPACFLTACFHIRRPVLVLFDDYVSRPAYSIVEKLFEPRRTIGRMAEFLIEPRDFNVHDLSLLLAAVTNPTFAGRTIDYSM